MRRCGTEPLPDSRLRGECLDREWFANLREARILIEQWRWEYNTQRPHSSLGYRTPAEVGRETRKTEVAAHPIMMIRSPIPGPAGPTFSG